MRWFPWVVAGCSSPAGVVLETTTDGGTWTVALIDAPDEAGGQVLRAVLEPTDGQIAAVVASMPDMGHASDAGIEDQGNGRFALDLELVMAGWWILDGTVTDADRGSSPQGRAEETFRLELEVP